MTRFRLYLGILIFFISTPSHSIYFSDYFFDPIYESVKIRPSQKLDSETFQQHFIKKIKSINQHVPKGTKSIHFRVSLIVEKNGSLTYQKITFAEEAVNNIEKLEKKLKKIINTAPVWNPAIKDGVVVRSSITLPITISINN